jgi:ABC-type transporter Mla subunit MlaD
MSDMVKPMDNEQEHPDLWAIAIKEMRENINYLKLGVRVRLELEKVKTQNEIEQASMDIANTAGLINGLIQSVQVGLDTMNKTMVDLRETMRLTNVMIEEAHAKKKEVDDYVELKKTSVEFTEKDNIDKIKSYAKYVGMFIGGILSMLGINAVA